MIKAPFLALERDKQRERTKSIKDFEDKKGCQGTHTLSYGSLGEHQQEIIIQQEVEKLEGEQQRDTKALSESKEEVKEKPIKEVLINNHHGKN
jgi:hypothetical protein